MRSQSLMMQIWRATICPIGMYRWRESLGTVTPGAPTMRCQATFALANLDSLSGQSKDGRDWPVEHTNKYFYHFVYVFKSDEPNCMTQTNRRVGISQLTSCSIRAPVPCRSYGMLPAELQEPEMRSQRYLTPQTRVETPFMFPITDATSLNWAPCFVAACDRQ